MAKTPSKSSSSPGVHETKVLCCRSLPCIMRASGKGYTSVASSIAGKPDTSDGSADMLKAVRLLSSPHFWGAFVLSQERPALTKFTSGRHDCLSMLHHSELQHMLLLLQHRSLEDRQQLSTWRSPNSADARHTPKNPHLLISRQNCDACSACSSETA